VYRANADAKESSHLRVIRDAEKLQIVDTLTSSHEGVVAFGNILKTIDVLFYEIFKYETQLFLDTKHNTQLTQLTTLDKRGRKTIVVENIQFHQKNLCSINFI